MTSYRDIEEPLAKMRIFFEREKEREGAERALKSALEIVGVDCSVEFGAIADEDWKLAYRRHFKTEEIGAQLVIVPAWESVPNSGRLPIVLDPGMAFGTGKHETTRACLEFIDEESSKGGTCLDMGCGSGILSIAAEKLGFKDVLGFDVDEEAVNASIENAEKNKAKVKYVKFALGRNDGRRVSDKKYDLVVANILGPLLIRFADEIVSYVNDRLIISGILTEIYDEVLSAYTSRGFKELKRKTIGEWTSGIMTLKI